MDPNDVALLLITVIVDYMAILIVMKMTTILSEEMILMMAIMIFQMILFLVLQREGEIQQVWVFQFNVQPVTWLVNMLFLITEHCKYNSTTSYPRSIRLTNILTASHVLPRFSCLPLLIHLFTPFTHIQPNLCQQAQCGHLCFGP